MATVLNTLLGRTKKGKKKAAGAGAKGKKKATTRRRNSGSASSVTPSLDVRGPDAVKQLTNMLKDNKVVLVLVYADWCGHCKTFKKDIWEPLSNLPDRKLPMVQIPAEELPNTPLKNAPVDGYPTTLLAGNDGKVEPLENNRDMKSMTTLVNADPNALLNLPPGNSADPTQSANEAAEATANAGIDENSENLLSKEGAEGLEEMSESIPNPPNVEEDLLASQQSGTFTGQALNSQGAPILATPTGPTVGGSLYAALMAAAKDVAPAALLTGAAVVASRQRQATRRARALRRRRLATARKLRLVAATRAK